MKVYRNVEIETEEIQVGDVIRFSLKNGENAEAMAVEKQTEWFSVLWTASKKNIR